MAEIPTDSPPAPQDINAMEELMKTVSDSPNDNEAIEETEAPPKTEEKVAPPEDKKEPAEEKPKGDDAADTKDDPKEEEEKEEEVPEESDDWEKDIDKIQVRKEAGPRTKGVIKVLKQKAKEEHKAAKELRQKYEEVEAKLKEAKPVTPELEKELTDLRAFRRTVDLENDPEFQQQFTNAIKGHEEEAIRLLQSWRLPETAAKYIQEHGGVLKFRTSQERMPNDPRFKNEDGSLMTHEQWWKSKVDDNMTTSQKEEINDLLTSLRQVHRQRDFTIQEAKKNKDVYFQQQQEAAVREAEDWTKRIEAHAKKTLDTYGEVAKLKEIPPNASPAEKQAIEQHNANYHRAEKIAQKYVTEITPENLVEAAIATAYSTFAREELKAERDGRAKDQAELKALKQELQDIKEAGKTSRKGASAAPPQKTDVKPKQIRNDADAMTALMNEQEK